MDTTLMLLLIAALLLNAGIIVRSCVAGARLRGKSPAAAAVYSLLLCTVGAYLLITVISEASGGDGWTLAAICVGVPDLIAVLISRHGEITQEAKEAMDALNAQIQTGGEPANPDAPPAEPALPARKLENPCTVVLTRTHAVAGELLPIKLMMNWEPFKIRSGQVLGLETKEATNCIVNLGNGYSLISGCVFPATSGGTVKLFCNASKFFADRTVLLDSEGNERHGNANEECQITVIREYCFGDNKSSVPVRLDGEKQGTLKSGETLTFKTCEESVSIRLGSLNLAVSLADARQLRLFFNNEGILYEKTVMSTEPPAKKA